jgi:ribosome modulation factor
MSPEVKEAYERGRDARYTERSVRSNPFPVNSAERSAWYRGWTDHDRDVVTRLVMGADCRSGG